MNFATTFSRLSRDATPLFIKDELDQQNAKELRAQVSLADFTFFKIIVTDYSLIEIKGRSLTVTCRQSYCISQVNQDRLTTRL